MARHGRATIPFGKYRGVRVRHLPDGYLSWLADALANDRTVQAQPLLFGGFEPVPRETWGWLLESVLAEMRHRGFRDDRVDGEVDPDIDAEQTALAVKTSGRAFYFDER